MVDRAFVGFNFINDLMNENIQKNIVTLISPVSFMDL